jgi:hypothetical protein
MSSGKVLQFILALGDRHKPPQAFIIVERNAIQQPTLLKAVDYCFKLFYVLDPPSCQIHLVYEVPVRKGHVTWQ